MLRNTGYEVTIAENGRQEVDLFRRRDGRFALVLLDLAMPLMGGPQTIRELKAIRPEVILDLPVDDEAKVVAFSGVIQPRTRRHHN